MRKTKNDVVFFSLLGLTQRVNMCVEKSTSIYNANFVLYANGPQCISRTCSCSVSIRQLCSPASVQLTRERASNVCSSCFSNAYNATLSYRQFSGNRRLLQWNEAKVETDLIEDVYEPFSILTNFSGCSPNFRLTMTLMCKFCIRVSHQNICNSDFH